MNRLIAILGFVLIGAHILTEVHGFIYDVFPKINEMNVDLFWSKDFKLKLNLHWYIKMLSDDLFVVICFYVMAKIAAQYSFKLFLICGIYMMYHVIDAFCFMYNYKQTTEIYYALVLCSSAATLILITPSKMKIVK